MSPTASSQAKSIHLLRALLREATYLPDAVARQYFARYILNRFRAYQPSENATASMDIEAVGKYRHRSFKRRQLSIIAERTTKVQKKAQKGLHYLRRANQGEIPCLQKVLFFAYGRIGRRKYALLGDVLKPDPITDGGRMVKPSDLLERTPLQKMYYSNKKYLQYLDAPKEANGIRPCTTFGCVPMPIVRARNNVRRWYAETMTRFLPPLPTEEWDKMQAMVEGSERVSLVKRRVPVRPLPEATDYDDSLHAVLQGMSLSKLSKSDRPNGIWRPHNITPKFMRRLYSRILQLCCKVEYSAERKQWVAVWGQPIHAIRPEVYEAATDPSLFSGVDAKGRLPPAPKAHVLKAEPGLDIQPRNEKGEYIRFPFFTEQLPEDNPMRMQLEAWKKQRLAAGIIDENGNFRGR
ncbi:hypothetical protein SNOG_05806 [Parastagonospora nodorum SN15]|uniref:LYR motif-containing protein Cup1-like N-terminal domain-containing protein n=1 Tax=Phaeosphaeria nodorum (strain SN15 / ATCC MYA-4574 / FGSC 10173) TaxID=321614 RepID=Q0UR08_PHANO|nr:hypothetical protein SNOG_05806 [Parastagonospora nodorum SN15]EAT86870.1 hypothetical protein SNOG_05806 [Parastagonospora nodorum SN15]